MVHSAIPLLALTTGLTGLATATLPSPIAAPSWILIPPSLGLVSLWWMSGRVDGKMRTVLPEIHTVRQLALAFRPILRLTFDAMEDEKVMYSEAEACRLRHDILGPLNVASGFLELLSMELGGAGESVAVEYLNRARDGVSRAIAVAITIGTPPADALDGEDPSAPGSTDLSSGSGNTEGNS